MPFDYTIDPANQLITITGTGPATLQERIDCVKRMMNDQSIAGEFHILIDVCRVSNSPSSGDIRSIVSLIELLLVKFKGRVAILNTHAGHVTVTHLIALSAVSGPDDVRAFMAEEEAREWLRTGVSSSGA